MKIEQWPNKLGWNVGQHEVWDLPERPYIAVRTFRNGEGYRFSRFPRGTDLIDAVKLTKRYGKFCYDA